MSSRMAAMPPLPTRLVTCRTSRIRSTTVRSPISCLISALHSHRMKRRGKTWPRRRRESGNTCTSGRRNVAPATLTNGAAPPGRAPILVPPFHPIDIRTIMAPSKLPSGSPQAAQDAVSRYEVSEQIGHLLRKAYQRHLAIFSQTIDDPQLTAVQFAVLSANRRPGPSSISDLAKATAIDAATVRALLHPLRARYLTY